MAKQKSVETDKGGAAEEALRHYFRNLGAFVLRGVPVREGRDDILTSIFGPIPEQASTHDTSPSSTSRTRSARRDMKG